MTATEQWRERYMRMSPGEHKELEELRAKYPPCSMADIEFGHIVVVMRGEQEVEFFHEEKAAGAWMQHVYGMTPQDAAKAGIIRHEVVYEKAGVTTNVPTTELLTIKHIRDRGPKAGDLLIYVDEGEYYHNGVGILDHSYGRDTLSVCFSASAFRVGNQISCSGGPIPAVSPANLVFDGLRETWFWRWNRGYSGGGEGGHYSIHVPSWRWDGTEVSI
jgi:hypothetical protein